MTDPLRLVPLLLLVLVPPATPDIVLRHDVDHDESVAAARGYTGLAHLNFRTPRGFLEGEATLVHPQWLVTAAHVTRRLQPGHVVSVGAEDVEVAEVVRHPAWRPGPGGAPDLALVRLARPVRQTPPVPLYRESDEVGREVILLGLGDHGDGRTGPAGNDGRVRMATNRVDAADEATLRFDFDPPDAADVTRYEGVSGPGDSGGPALIVTDEGIRLAGISSGQSRGTAEGRGRYGVVEHYTRVSAFAAWIDSVIAGGG